MIGPIRPGKDKSPPNKNDLVVPENSLKPEGASTGKQERFLFGLGLVGAALAALCCATPLLVALLPAVGLGAWFGGADWVLVTLLFVSGGVIALALIRRRRQTEARFETE